MDWSDLFQKHVGMMNMCEHFFGSWQVWHFEAGEGGGEAWSSRPAIGAYHGTTTSCVPTPEFPAAAEAVQEHHHGGPRRARHAHRQVLRLHRSWPRPEVLVHYLCCLLGQLPHLYIVSSHCCAYFLCEMISWSHLNVGCQMNSLESNACLASLLKDHQKNLELCIVHPVYLDIHTGRLLLSSFQKWHSFAGVLRIGGADHRLDVCGHAPHPLAWWGLPLCGCWMVGLLLLVKYPLSLSTFDHSWIGCT